jgi:hypothetical protein
MFKADDRARKAGWISLRVIGAIGAAVMAMTTDVRIDGRRDGRDAVRTDGHAGGPWCVTAPERDSGKSCGYLTFDRCLKAVASIGGTCRPNPATALIADDGPYRTYRPIYLDRAQQRL